MQNPRFSQKAFPQPPSWIWRVLGWWRIGCRRRRLGRWRFRRRRICRRWVRRRRIRWRRVRRRRVGWRRVRRCGVWTWGVGRPQGSGRPNGGGGRPGIGRFYGCPRLGGGRFIGREHIECGCGSGLGSFRWYGGGRIAGSQRLRRDRRRGAGRPVRWGGGRLDRGVGVSRQRHQGLAGAQGSRGIGGDGRHGRLETDNHRRQAFGRLGGICILDDLADQADRNRRLGRRMQVG